MHTGVVTVFLRWYLRRVERTEDPALADLHRRLLDGVAGEVVEVGCGRGALFRHYPSAVEHLVAVEPDPACRAAADVAARGAGVGEVVDVVDADAEHLPVDGASVDAVVFAEVLCSVPHPQRALAEARRVLRPGGRLHVYEHVRADPLWGATLQRGVDLAGWSWVFGGCHTSRDTASQVERAGFAWERRERVWYTSAPLAAPAGPHVLGVAVAPVRTGRS